MHCQRCLDVTKVEVDHYEHEKARVPGLLILPGDPFQVMYRPRYERGVRCPSSPAVSVVEADHTVVLWAEELLHELILTAKDGDWDRPDRRLAH